MIDDAATDEALLIAARTDADAFTRFYRRHATPVLGYLVRRTRDPELGADLTAETFACALEGLDRFDPERGSAVNWLRILALAESEATAALLADALEALPPDQRAALNARVLDERDYDAIARDSGAAEATIRKRVSRALDSLRSSLGGQP